MDVNYNILEGVLILLTCAVVAATVFRRLHLPPVLSYLVVGTVVGPYCLGLIPNKEATRHLAEFGVVFLMFTVGLEFSLAKLVSLKRTVLGLGGLQVALTTLITMGVAMIEGYSVPTALVIGGVVTMSSTAIVVKQLNDQLELNSMHGQNALGILLFQDLAVIVFLILIPSLGSGEDVYIPLLLALIKAAGVIVTIVLAGRWILRPLFHEIALSKSIEVFTLTILLVTLSAGWLTESMGLSMALGAFLAGMMLGETEFRHQIEVEIRPFRDILLGLFFITIGMLINIKALPQIWPHVLILLATMVIGKTVLIAAISRFMGSNLATALRTGLVLAQGGEFGFALLTLALQGNLLKPGVSQIVLSALVFSMAMSPFLIRYNKWISARLVPKASRAREGVIRDSVAATAASLNQHVIICGFGRVGQNIARFLETEGFQFIALDMDPERVQNAQLAGEPVTYGNSVNFYVLEAAGLAHARALIISFDDVPATFKILAQVRAAYPKLPILVRTRDDSHLKELLHEGATEVVPETSEASLMLAFHTLMLMDVSAARALKQVRYIRQNHYNLLHQVFPSHELADLEDAADITRKELYALSLPDNASAIGKTLGDLPLEENNILVTAIRRAGIRRPYPEKQTELKAGDVLVLYGTPPDLECAEKLLLERS